MQVEFAGAAELGGSLALRAARDSPSDLTRTQATPAAAFRAARRTYLRGQRVDMQALAANKSIGETANVYLLLGDPALPFTLPAPAAPAGNSSGGIE